MLNSSCSELAALRFRRGAGHHLWVKDGRFYVRFSVALPGPFKAHRRKCFALGTADFAEACRKRDAFLSALAAWERPPLRSVPGKSGGFHPWTGVVRATVAAEGSSK